MSKPEIVEEKHVNFAPSKPEAKSPQEQRIERNEAIEKIREEKEQPRKDFLLSGKGKASEFFDVTTNRAEVEAFTGKQTHKEIEDLTESEREKFLRDGELIPAKPNGKAAETPAAKPPERPKLADYRDENGEIKHEDYEKALDRYEAEKTAFEKQQAAAPKIDAELDREAFEEIGRRQDWWAEPSHIESHKTMPQRTVAALQALSPEEKSVIANSPVRTMQLNPQLDAFLGHALADVKNLAHVHVELARDPAIMQRVADDWAKTAPGTKERWVTEQAIRYVLKIMDKRGKSAGSRPNGAARRTDNLTRAGKPPAEAAGGTSSPSDDGSSEAAWKRKDLSSEERGELYRTRKNAEEAAARRKRYGRR